MQQRKPAYKSTQFALNEQLTRSDGEAQLNARRITAGDESLGPFASVGLESHYEDGVPAWTCEIMQRTRFRNFGSTALQMAYVAKGSMVATIASSPKLWDIAGGVVIAEAAGAVVTDWQGQRILPVDLDRYEGFSVFYAAGPPEAQICGGQRVGVVGGGNSAGQAAVWLARGGALVTLLHRRA